MADLSKYSTYELFNELHARDHVAVCVFVDEDVASCLENFNISPTDDLLDRFWASWKRGIEDCMCENGFSAIYEGIYDIKED